MQWDKLERSYTALDKLLHSLQPSDRFSLLLFNTEMKAFRSSPVAADPATIEKAVEFVRSSDLRGGTNLQEALRLGLAQCAMPQGVGERDLVLLSDGGATRGIIQDGRLAAGYSGW